MKSSLFPYPVPQPPTELKVQTHLEQVTLYWTPPPTISQSYIYRVFLLKKPQGIYRKQMFPIWLRVCYVYFIQA